MKYSPFLLLRLFPLLMILLALYSCANIIPPGGGPKDTLPPKLVNSLPKDSATSVNPKIITLTFDEYVVVQGVQENLIVSPTLKTVPQVDYKLRNVTIRLKDSLEANTTYSFNFGDAIKDVNEGNIKHKFTYVFATGNALDVNTYKGKVLLAEKGKVDSTLIVILHKNLADTAIVKLRPRYYARLNGKGEFTFRFLPAGTFAVYVLPNDFTRKYDDSTKLFAFRSTPLVIGENGAPSYDTLFAYEAFKKKEKAPAVQASGKPPAGKEDKRLRYMISADNGVQDLLSNLTITFNRKLAVFDSSKMLLTDSNYHKLSGYSFSLDTGKTKVVLKYPWKDYTAYRVLFAKDAVADTAKVTLAKADTIRFFSKKETEYGSVRLRFINLDLSKNPVLQILQNDKLIEAIPLTSNEFKRNLFPPGSYDLRVLYDKNKNGIWDPGNFFSTKRQPEIVQLIPKQLVIRGNWDNEVNIQL